MFKDVNDYTYNSEKTSQIMKIPNNREMSQ